MSDCPFAFHCLFNLERTRCTMEPAGVLFSSQDIGRPRVDVLSQELVRAVCFLCSTPFSQSPQVSRHSVSRPFGVQEPHSAFFAIRCPGIRLAAAATSTYIPYFRQRGEGSGGGGSRDTQAPLGEWLWRMSLAVFVCLLFPGAPEIPC